MSRETELDEIRPNTVINADKTISKKIINAVALGLLALLLLVAVIVKNGSAADAKSATRKQPITLAETKPAERVIYQTPEPPTASANTAQQEEREAAAVEEKRRDLQVALQQAIEAEKMRQARLKSPIMIGYEPAVPLVAKAETPKQPGEPQSLGRDGNSQFLAANTGKSVPINKPYKIENLEYKILQGKYIPLVVEPRAISDLAGQVCGRVDNDVFGAQGRVKLITWGSQVCGVYRAEIKQGQNRVFIVWNRLVRDDGLAVNIDSPGVDQLGTAGMGGEVDNHFWQIFGNALMISIIGSGTSTMGVNGSDNYNSAAMLRSNTQEAFSETADSILSQYANIPPTIITKPGSTARIYVRGDLDFSKYYIEPEKPVEEQQSYFEY